MAKKAKETQQDTTPEQAEAPEENLREEDEGVLHAFARHQQEGYKQSFQAVESLFPENFREHTREAGRSFVRSFKVLTRSVAKGIQEATAAGEDDSADETTTGKTKVKVEVN